MYWRFCKNVIPTKKVAHTMSRPVIGGQISYFILISIIVTIRQQQLHSCLSLDIVSPRSFAHKILKYHIWLTFYAFLYLPYFSFILLSILLSILEYCYTTSDILSPFYWPLLGFGFNLTHLSIFFILSCDSIELSSTVNSIISQFLMQLQNHIIHINHTNSLIFGLYRTL